MKVLGGAARMPLRQQPRNNGAGSHIDPETLLNARAARSVQAKAKGHLCIHIWQAETKTEAGAAFDWFFVETYGAKS